MIKYQKTFNWILVFFTMTGMSTAQTGWVQTQLNAGMGRSLYSTDTELYASTLDGVFSTTDNGMPWFSKGLADHDVYDVIISHQYILAATSTGIYRSSDNGTNWMPTNGSPPNLAGGGGIHGSHLFAKNSSYVFVIAWALGIYRSGDDGENWQQMYVGQDGAGFQDYAAAATCIGAVGEKIIFGRADNNPFLIFSSSDNGNSWVGTTLSRSDGMQDQLLCFYNDNGNLFAGGFMGLYLSTDLGNSWITQYDGLNVSLGIFRDIVSYNQNLFAAVDFNSIQISRDNGINWTSFNDGLISDWTFSALAIKPPYIWAILGFFGNAYRCSLNDIVPQVENNGSSIPKECYLYNNYPNPFNPLTEIKYDIPKTSFVVLEVYNVIGEKVSSLVNEEKAPGKYNVHFNGNNFGSGLYFYTLSTDNFIQTKKMVLLK
jgi:hypothetical protein